MIFTTNKALKAWGRVLHDEDLAQAIIDRVLERGRLIRLDGPSVRTLHLKLDDALKDDSDQDDEVARISGNKWPEFPEPTSASQTEAGVGCSSVDSSSFARCSKGNGISGRSRAVGFAACHAVRSCLPSTTVSAWRRCIEARKTPGLDVAAGGARRTTIRVVSSRCPGAYRTLGVAGDHGARRASGSARSSDTADRPCSGQRRASRPARPSNNQQNDSQCDERRVRRYRRSVEHSRLSASSRVGSSRRHSLATSRRAVL